MLRERTARGHDGHARHGHEKGQVLGSWDPYNSVIISESSGSVSYQDIIEGTTYREEADEQTGHREKVIVETRDRTLTPALIARLP